MTSAVASVTWAVASILGRAGLVDFRPNAAGGDTYLETWPPVDIDDEAVLIRTESATTEYGVEGYTSIISIEVRGTLNGQMAVQARANSIYLALLNLAAPSVEVAGNGLYLTVCGSWPLPPMVNVTDPAGRPTSMLTARISHTEPAQPGGSPAFFPVYAVQGWNTPVVLTISNEDGIVDTTVAATTCTLYSAQYGDVVTTLTCVPSSGGVVTIEAPVPNTIPVGTYWYEITFDSDGGGELAAFPLLHGTWRVRAT